MYIRNCTPLTHQLKQFLKIFKLKIYKITFSSFAPDALFGCYGTDDNSISVHAGCQQYTFLKKNLKKKLCKTLYKRYTVIIYMFNFFVSFELIYRKRLAQCVH